MIERAIATIGVLFIATVLTGLMTVHNDSLQKILKAAVAAEFAVIVLIGIYLIWTVEP